MFCALLKAANLPQCFSYCLDHKLQGLLGRDKSPQDGHEADLEGWCRGPTCWVFS